MVRRFSVYDLVDFLFSEHEVFVGWDDAYGLAERVSSMFPDTDIARAFKEEGDYDRVYNVFTTMVNKLLNEHCSLVEEYEMESGETVKAWLYRCSLPGVGVFYVGDVHADRVNQTYSILVASKRKKRALRDMLRVFEEEVKEEE